MQVHASAEQQRRTCCVSLVTLHWSRYLLCAVLLYLELILSRIHSQGFFLYNISATHSKNTTHHGLYYRRMRFSYNTNEKKQKVYGGKKAR